MINWVTEKDNIYKAMMQEVRCGNREKAVEIIKEGYERFKNELGPDNPFTLTLMHLYSSRLKDIGCIDESIDMMYRCFQLRKKVLSENDLDTIRSANAYVVYKGEKMGPQYTKDMLEKIYNFQMSHLKANNDYIENYLKQENRDNKDLNDFLTLTMTIFFNYANRLSYIGSRWEALTWMMECFKQSKKYLGDLHNITLRSEHNIISRYISVGLNDKALYQSIVCYKDRCRKKGYPLMHVYSTKGLMIELLANKIYNHHEISLDLSNQLATTDIFDEKFLKLICTDYNEKDALNYLIDVLNDMLSDFNRAEDNRTYEKLHFQCILAVLYSYVHDVRYIKVVNDVIDKINNSPDYSNYNVDVYKLYVTMAEHVVYSRDDVYKDINAKDMAKKVYEACKAYIGEYNHATLACVYKIAVMESMDNIENYFTYTQDFFDKLDVFISDCLIANNKHEMVQSADFICSCFDDYVSKVFKNKEYVENNKSLLNPLIKYKNLIYDLDLFKYSYQNDSIKKKYVDSLSIESVANLQKVLDADTCAIDVFALADDDELGVLLINDNSFNVLLIENSIEGIKSLQKNTNIRENIYIALDDELQIEENDGDKKFYNKAKDFYDLDGNISFLSLLKNLIHYEYNNDLNEFKIKVFADAEDDIKNFDDGESAKEEFIESKNRFFRDSKYEQFKLPELPFAYMEGVNIKKSFNNECELFLKKEVNYKNFCEHQGVNVLHTAIHGGYINNKDIDNPLEKSRIYLSGRINYLRDNFFSNTYKYGYVSAKDIVNMDFNDTSAVVLSGCSTGVGDYLKFEGDYSFKRAFELVSVNTIIATVEEVDDVISAFFMGTLYSRLSVNHSLYQSFIEAQEQTKHLTSKKLHEWLNTHVLNNEDLAYLNSEEKEYYENKYKDILESDYEIYNDDWKKYIYMGKRI